MSPKLGCANVTEKYVLSVVNLLFALGGLILLILGIAVQAKISNINKLLGSQFQMAPISAMVIGGIIFVVAFLGCCGAIKENACLLISFAIIMIVLMVLKIAVAVFILTQMDEFLKHINSGIDEFHQQKELGSIESVFKCCGPNGASSYPGSLPEHCCPPNKLPCKPGDAFKGCKTVIPKYLRSHGSCIAYVVLVVAAIELLAAVMALRLANASRKSNPNTEAQQN